MLPEPTTGNAGTSTLSFGTLTRRTPLSASTPRLGFVVGNAEIVERIDLLQDHARAGIFVPVQEAGIAALSGPQESVAERRDTYQRRRDRVLDALAGTRVAAPVCEGTFYVWIQLPEDMSLEQLLVSTGSQSRPVRASARRERAGRASSWR